MKERRLNKQNLTYLMIWSVAILSLVFVPYWLSFTSIWSEPFVDPNIQIARDNTAIQPMNGRADGTILWDEFLLPPDPAEQVKLAAWWHGAGKILISLVCSFGLVFVVWLIYLFFDWLFPKTEVK